MGYFIVINELFGIVDGKFMNSHNSITKNSLKYMNNYK